MIHPVFQIVIGLLLAVGLMSCFWLVQRRTKNAGIVDVAWSGTIGVLGVFFAVTAGGDLGRRWLAGALIGLWSLRLTTYLYRRVVGHPEEGRYATLRTNWGPQADRRLFRFFQIAGCGRVGICLAGPGGRLEQEPFECLRRIGKRRPLADRGDGSDCCRQAARTFPSKSGEPRQDVPKGAVALLAAPQLLLQWIHWWAYLPIALGAGYWWIALLVPLLLLYFVLCVTGIPPTEAQALASRGEDYRHYQRTTSAFVPWFPRKEVSFIRSDFR